MVLLVDARPVPIAIVEPSAAVLTGVLVLADRAACVAGIVFTAVIDLEPVTRIGNALSAAVNVGHEIPATACLVLHKLCAVVPCTPLGIPVVVEMRLDGLVSTRVGGLTALTFVRPDITLGVLVIGVSPDEASAQHLVTLRAHSHRPAKRGVVHSVGMAVNTALTLDVETAGHTRAWPATDNRDHTSHVIRDGDRAAVCELRHDVTDEIGWNVRPVACQILANRCDHSFDVAVAVVHGTALVPCVGQSVGVSERLVRPLKDDTLPVGWLVQVEHLTDCGVQVVAVVLLLEPLASLVTAAVVVAPIGLGDPVVHIASQDADRWVDPVTPERRCLTQVCELVACHFAFS